MRIAAAAALLAIAPLMVQARVNFKREVQPILAVHCVRCHGSKLAAKGLRLHTKQRAMMAIEARNPENSRAYVAAKTGYMPPTARKLTDRELDVFRRWILEGAKWPKNLEIEEELRIEKGAKMMLWQSRRSTSPKTLSPSRTLSGTPTV